MFMNHPLTVPAILVAVAALIVVVRALCHTGYSRRMARRVEGCRPLTYTDARGRGCAACR
jgi:hypothetical protein